MKDEDSPTQFYLNIITELDFNPKKISGVLSCLIDVSGHLAEHDLSNYRCIICLQYYLSCNL